MTGAEIAAAIAKAVASEIAKQATQGILGRWRRKVLDEREQRAFAAALEPALATFIARYPRMRSSLFDDHFLIHAGAPVLARLVEAGEGPTGEELAFAYWTQFPTAPAEKRDPEITLAAGDFLDMLRIALRLNPLFRPRFDSLALDRTVDLLGVLPSPASPPGEVWNLPASLPTFAGRHAELESLGRHRAVAVHGLGGAGKTMLIAEYARLRRDRLKVGWWVRAADTAVRASDFASLGAVLGLPEARDPDQRAAIAAVRTWLGANHDWLLVLDGAPGLEAIRDLLPVQLGGQLIVTSHRHEDWRSAGFTPIQVDVWPRNVATEFLQDRTGDADPESAAAISRRLGDLPLALEQASAYVVRQAIPLATYAERLDERGPETLGIETTWDLSFAQVRSEPGVGELLGLLAYLAPDELPREILSGASSGAIEDAIELLLGYSLLTPSGDAVRMHALVQEKVRAGDDGASLPLTLTVVASAFPADVKDPRTWPAAQALVAHALTVAHHAEQAGVMPEVVAGLLHNVAVLFAERGEFAPAVELFERALARKRQAYGDAHQRLVLTLLGLGSAQRSLGRFDAAWSALDRAQQISLATSESEDATTARVIASIATLAAERGNFDDAQAAGEHALKLLRSALGDDHPQVAGLMINLATFARLRFDFLSAHRYAEHALAIAEGASDGGEALAGVALLNLAGTAHDAGDLLKSERLFHEASQVLVTAYGPIHPAVAVAEENLGALLIARERFAEAAAKLQRALQLTRSLFGDQHPRVAGVLLKQSSLHRHARDWPRAESTVRSALAILEAAYGAEHRETIQAEAALANVRRLSGHVDEGAARLASALQRAEATLGSRHPTVAEIQENLGMALVQRADAAAALPHLDVALATNSEVYGPSHPRVAMSLMGVGIALAQQGRPELARDRYQEALKIFIAVYGANHYRVAEATAKLAQVLAVSGEPASARAYARQAVGMVEAQLGSEHPALVPLLHAQADLAIVADELGGARRELERALSLTNPQTNPGMHITTLVRLANVAGALGDFGAVTTHLQATIDAVDVMPDGFLGDALPELLIHHSQTLVADGRAEEARPFVERLLAFGDPGNLSARYSALTLASLVEAAADELERSRSLMGEAFGVAIKAPLLRRM